MTPLAPAGAPGSIQARTHHIIFDHDTRASRAFDVVLIGAILSSVAVVMLDSVGDLSARYHLQFAFLEWFFTVLFTLEYALRLWSVRSPKTYALSFFGVIDLLAVLPMYVSLLVPGGQFLIVVRMLRVMRIFRIFELAQYVGEANELTRAFKASQYRITVFLLAVTSIVTVVGSLIFVIEGAEAGFTSIPRSVYWAIVTLTTVGYGDLVPATAVGTTLASLLMVLGYGMIAVPMGIVTAEMVVARGGAKPGTPCPSCGRREPDPDASASYCRWCGAPSAGR